MKLAYRSNYDLSTEELTSLEKIVKEKVEVIKVGEGSVDGEDWLKLIERKDINLIAERVNWGHREELFKTGKPVLLTQNRGEFVNGYLKITFNGWYQIFNPNGFKTQRIVAPFEGMAV